MNMRPLQPPGESLSLPLSDTTYVLSAEQQDELQADLAGLVATSHSRRSIEQDPQPRKAETAQDFHEITRSILAAAANNESGALGVQIISEVQQKTGYEPAAVGAVFMELGEQGVVARSLTDPKVGVVLTEQGMLLHQNYDQMMNPE